MSSTRLSSFSVKNNLSKNDYSSIRGGTTRLPVDGSLYAWYEAKPENLIFSGSSVTSWIDSSGNGINLTNTANYPTYISNSYNNLGGVAFDGSTQLLQNSNFQLWEEFPTYTIESPPPGKTRTTRNFKLRYGATVFLVAKHGTFNSNSCPLALDFSLDGTTYRNQDFIFNYNGTQGANPSIYGGVTATPADQGVNTTGVNLNVGIPYVFTYRMTTGSAFPLYIRVNKTNHSLTNMAGGNGFYMRWYHQSPITGTITTGARRNSSTNAYSGYFNGEINEIVIFKRELTENEIVKVEDYLGTKWGAF